jgi:thiol-disulfide isomerase/thioredoxin
MQRLRFSSPFLAMFLVIAIVFFVLTAVRAEGIDPERLKDRGEAAELTNNTWINSDKPLRLSDLRGKVVLLEFWTFGCINCKNTLPFMKETYEKYKPKGVEFIGVHYPEFPYERDVNNVRDFVKKEGIKHPVTIDNDGVAWRAYDMHAWPAFIIVDKTGHIRYRQIGEGSYDTIRAALDTLLGEIKMSDNPLVARDYGAAPELNNTTWINTDNKPRKLADLRGQVVLLEFWTFGCYNCVNTFPAMKEWHAKYKDKGLVIIGDHFPEFAYEREIENVRNAVKRFGIEYAVAIDNDGATWAAYGNRYWPTMYLIDKRGHIRYIAIGEHDYSRTDQAIQALLAE